LTLHALGDILHRQSRKKGETDEETYKETEINFVEKVEGE
jgi:hypothetical protein